MTAALLSLAVLLSAAPPVPARPAPLDVDGLIRVLDGWSARLGADDTAPIDPAGLRRELPPFWEVATVDGPIAVPTRWLREALAGVASNPESQTCVARAVRERLAALGREVRALSTETSGPAASDARSVLKRVLSRREFDGLAESSFLAALRDRIREWMGDHFAWLIDAVRGAPVAGEAIAWSLLAAALAILALWARRAWRWPAGPAPLRLSRSPVHGETPADATAEARAAAVRGEHREAVRWAYAAAVQILTARERLRADRSRTHRELLRSIPEGEAWRPPFVELTRLFERIWYGRLRAEPGDAALALGELERLGGALS